MRKKAPIAAKQFLNTAWTGEPNLCKIQSPRWFPLFLNDNEKMRYIADLHIHSPFSRATSKAGNLQGLAAWARVKGIHLLGTGDFTHPGWFSQLKEHLEPAEPGFYKRKDEAIPPALSQATPVALPSRFLLTAEI